MSKAVAAKPLADVNVLVTRPREQSDDLVARIAELGGKALLLPALEIAPSQKPDELALALERLCDYDWLVLTSVNGVAAVAAFLAEIPSRVKIAAIGPATSEAIQARFRTPDFVPAEYMSSAIAHGLGQVKGKRILLARADIARKNLAHELTAMGAEVTEVEAYSIKRARASELEETPDVITVTSSSAVRHTLENLTDLGKDNWRIEIPWICIGPITAETAFELGCQVAAVAYEYTVDGLVKALIGWANQ